MNIHVYTICYNEQELLPFFIRHYKQFASKIIVYDNESTDNSVEIALQHGCEVKTYQTDGQIRDDRMLNVKNTCWKESRWQNVDWVIVVDVDEIVYGRNMLQYLSDKRKDGYTIINPTGYQMISDPLPDLTSDKQIYELSDKGLRSQPYSKPCIFHPDSIDEINFTIGAHDCKPYGKIKRCSGGSLYLLHYNRLSLDWYLQRMRNRKQRLSDLNIKHKWGKQYEYEEQKHITMFTHDLRIAKPVIRQGVTNNPSLRSPRRLSRRRHTT